MQIAVGAVILAVTLAIAMVALVSAPRVRVYAMIRQGGLEVVANQPIRNGRLTVQKDGARYEMQFDELRVNEPLAVPLTMLAATTSDALLAINPGERVYLQVTGKSRTGRTLAAKARIRILK